MPWSGGSFNLSQDFLADAAAGPPDSFITAAKMDNVLEDLGDGLEACFNRNGDNAAAAHLSMGGFKLQSLGAAATTTDAVRARQIAENSIQYGGTTGGSSNAYTVTNAFLTAAATGTRLLLKANHTNSGAATLALNGGSAVAIRDIDDASLSSGVIANGKFFEVVYDETTAHWHLAKFLSSNDIGVSVQAYDALLVAIAALTTAADKGIYATGSDAVATYDLTSYGRTLAGLADAAALRTNLSLGALALLASINDGNWSGTDLAVGNGGTGASAAADARTNLSAAAKAQPWRKSVIIEFPDDGDYVFPDFFPGAVEITKVITDCDAGTCTLTTKINTTALGGTPNSVSTTREDQTHSTSNTTAQDDDLRFTVASNSGCERMQITLVGTITLA